MPAESASKLKLKFSILRTCLAGFQPVLEVTVVIN